LQGKRDKMQNWVVYGLIAAFFFGINPVIYKIAQQKGGFSPYLGSFIFGVGIVLVFQASSLS